MRALDPSFYSGREQALVKHYLLGSYFEYCGRIIAHSRIFPRIVFVDGFTGPWGSRSEDFSDTSFGIATGILSDLREIIQSKNLRVELQTFVIERDDTAFKQLRAAIERLRVPGIEPVHGGLSGIPCKGRLIKRA